MDEATASVYIAAIAAIASTISIVVSTKANKQAKETHTAVNSRMDEMLALTKSASFAEGVEQQRVKDER
jgi:enoyl-CoA hydratase/carnithine racemase